MIANVDISDYDKFGCLHELFIQQAKKTPDKIALVTADHKKITFSELNSVTDILADKLRLCGVRRNTVVGIFMERCIEYTVSYIAILKAGGAYLPIEMSYPKPLIQSVLEDAKPVAICSKSSYGHLLNTDITTLFLDNNWAEIYQKEVNQSKEKPIVEKVQLDDMAYTVYSSGTTGKPKGIQCPHRGAVFSYTWRHLAFPYDEDDREACNIFFVWEMLRPLLKGIPMFIIPDNVIYDPPKLVNFLKEHEITRMLFTPSLLQAVLDTQGGASLNESFKTMKQIWLCGEVVTTTLRNRIAAAFPWVKILNLYSISECHDVSCSDLTEGYGLEGRTYCPVGKIFKGVHVVVMDDDHNVKSIGDAGEVYVGGPTLAIGYLNRPELNEQRFIKTPAHLINAYGARLYRTGDWGYLLSDGSLEVTGRCDSMVKIRGYTVELKAVENALLSIPEVNMACATVFGEEGSDKFVAAYIVLNEGYSKNVDYLRSKLKGQLPFYMIPSQFVFLSKIPILDSSGKINKKELPPIRGFDAGNIKVENFANSIAKSIAKIWCEVLKICTLDDTDNFFDLGGHSLLAAVVVGRINDTFQTNLSTLDLYTNPTIESLLTKITTGESSQNSKINLIEEMSNLTITQISNLKLRLFWKSVNLTRDKFQRGNILLTGAAGYLGSFVLKYLLQNTQAIVYCLIRSSTEQTSQQRLENVLESKKISKEYLQTRLVLITGDVSLNKFGLDDIDYMSLSQNIDAVIHCAAKVNLILPFSALYSSNVQGTQTVVSFCTEDRLKPLHYISTNDVFPENLTDCSENSNMLNYADQLNYGYGQTKWLSEQIVLSAAKNGLPVIITRCGNIAGSLTMPIWNDNDSILLILKAVILSQTAPDINWKVELSPVDFVAESIVKLTTNVTNEFGKVFHFINSNTMDCREIWTFLNRTGYKINVVPYDEWIATVEKSSKHHAELGSLVQLLNTRLKTKDYLCNASTYRQDNVDKFLSEIGIEYPQFNETSLDKYVTNLINGRYIPAPEAKSISNNSPVNISKLPHLEGKIALVTGASSGIGRLIAKTLAQSGVTTVAAARRIDRLEELEIELKSQNIKTLIPMKMDITDKNQVFSCISRIKSTIGPINILVNNAGLMDYCKMINCELDIWVKMVNVNCIGLLNVTAAVLPHMKEIGSGHVVNITSDAGRKPFAGLAVYSGTKFFGESVSEAMRQEVTSENIKVTCIQPGDTVSELLDKSANLEIRKEMYTEVPFLQTEQVVNAVIFALNQPPNCAVNSILIEPIGAPI
ncbi:uncharacterized protein LOC135834874 [Planococcus citri]|uniref:uncharacterized protein LOC135834874 n=1 Tax=Planococcus citri TaxID=170843 RepID=UPI0031F7574E